MKIEDSVVSEAIIKGYLNKLLKGLKQDVAIIGGGPAGLTAAYYLANGGYDVAIFEREVSTGGGMWGGGIMFNKIVVQTEAKEILDEMGIDVYPYKENYFVADSIESVASLTLKAVKAGAQIFNLMNAEDVLVRNGKVTGVVVNWSSVESARLHVDPIAVKAKYVVDATGHTAAVASVLQSKQRIKLKTKTGSILGEQSMWAEVGEKTIVDNTKLIYPGLYATGMAANAIFGGPRMGPIFGGMLLSGRKVASLISNKLKE